MRDTDGTVTGKLALKPRVWTVPRHRMRCHKSDDRSARRGRYWMRMKRRRRERRGRKQKEEGQFRMIVAHASLTHMQKLEMIAEGKAALTYSLFKTFPKRN